MAGLSVRKTCSRFSRRCWRPSASSTLIWITYGYSLAFTGGGGLNDFVGGFSKVFLSGVDANAVAATFSNGVVIHELVYMAFQMTFACINAGPHRRCLSPSA